VTGDVGAAVVGGGGVGGGRAPIAKGLIVGTDIVIVDAPIVGGAVGRGVGIKLLNGAGADLGQKSPIHSNASALSGKLTLDP